MSKAVATETDSTEEVKLLIAAGDIDRANFANDYGYAGFDPNVTRTLLKLKENDRRVYINDVKTLIGLFLLRGTNLTKIASKSNDAAALTINALKAKYNIKDPGQGRLEKKDITMATIAQCYPEVVVNYMSKRPELVRRPPGLDRNVPDTMCSTVIASLIPQSEGPATRILLNAHFQFLVRLDAMINPKDPTDHETIKMYQMAAHRSQIVQEEDRVRIGDEMGWFVSEEGIVTPIDSMKAFNRGWEGGRTTDSDDDGSSLPKRRKMIKK